MPHQCTSCGRTFPDGSKEMLSGCPDCGGNKFQFKPAGAASDDAAAASDDPPATAPDDPPATASDDPPATVPDDSPAAASDDPPAAPDGHSSDSDDSASVEDTTVSTENGTASVDDDTASAGDDTDADGAEQLRDRTEENAAQANARSDVVSPDELDRASRDPDLGEPPAADETQPGVDALREELNDQFESIRIVSPGTYELNLMELYDRQEFIISLQEDGRYVIEMPDAWDAPDE